ncbi:MAG TPA: dihydroorotase family protein [Bacillota bacterium]
MAYDLAILGATVVTSHAEQRIHVYVKDGTIAELTRERLPAHREVDAHGLYLLPGVIDGHVHFMDPGETDREDFVHGSGAAAAGGVTTVVEHTHSRPVRTRADLAEKARYLAERSLVDYGLAAHITPSALERLPELWREGAAYFKAFTCTTHGIDGMTNAELLAAFRAVAELGGAVLLHCEDESILADAGRRLRAEGVDGGDALPLWRDRIAELVAVQTVALLCRLTAVRAIIAHCSHAEAVDLAAAERGRGADLWIETCPQYLYLREDEVHSHGPLRKFTPPARARSTAEGEALWQRVAHGPVTHISSDHAPATRAQKNRGIWDAPFGLPGVESTLPLLLEGVARGYLSLQRVVQLTSEAPARLYGFYPRKGLIRRGSDADLVLVDLNAQRPLTDDHIVSKAGWSPYAHIQPRGLPVYTFVRGQEVAANARPTGEPGWGRFVPGRGSAP